MERRSFLKGALTGAVCVVGCGLGPFKDDEDGCPKWPQSAPRKVHITPGGIEIHYPSWLDGHPNLISDAAVEVDTTPAENGTRTLLDPDARGWKVVIGNPGAIELAESPTGLVAGFVCYKHTTIYVAWRFPRSNPVLLSALGHEIGHVFGGPNANHGGAGCDGCMIEIA